MKIVLLLIVLIYSQGAFSGQDLSEKFLLDQIKSTPPSVQEIESLFLSQQANYLSKQDKYNFNLQGKAEVSKSNERLLSDFDGGVISRASQFGVGLSKITPFGVEVGVQVFGNKLRNAFVTDATTTGVSLNLAVDLLRNFSGRRSKKELKLSEQSVKRAELERANQLKVFEVSLRKAYWALVANSEQMRLLQYLVNLAQKQYKEAKNRFQSGVSDSGEVARYRSQWTTRQADSYSLEYDKVRLLSQLHQLLPSLDGKNLGLEKYNLKEMKAKVLECTVLISSLQKPPMEHTTYDEIVQSLEMEQELNRGLTKNYDSPDIKLVGEVARVGRDFSYTEAGRNITDDFGDRLRLGVEVTLPLGKSKSKTKDALNKANQFKFMSLAQKNLARVRAYHTETQKMILVLNNVITNNSKTIRAFEKSLKVSRRKFKQGRISVQELISEEDSELRSRLSEIQTNLTVINTLLDYFGIFKDFPCTFNRM